MNYTNPNIKEVSGPINVIRLEGNVGKIKKVIYLFMDLHLNLMDQRECDNIFSQDIQKYYVESFYNINKKNKIYDFFCEIPPNNIIETGHGVTYPTEINYKDIYIEEVWKVFRKLFVYEKKQNKVKLSNIMKNLRLHYVDIRTYFIPNFWDIYDELNRILSTIHTNISIMMLTNIKMLIKIYKSTYNTIISIVNNLRHHKIKIKNINNIINEHSKMETDKNYIEKITYLMNKILFSYKNNNIKDKVNNIINDMIKIMENDILEIDNFINKLDNYRSTVDKSKNQLLYNNRKKIYDYGIDDHLVNEIILDIITGISQIRINFINSTSFIMDIYFLRRFLDKNYITNAICYTGAAHSKIYILYLVKYFDFKITNTSYSKEKDINKLNNIIKEKTFQGELNEFLYPPLLTQCSDLTNFPKDFD